MSRPQHRSSQPKPGTDAALARELESTCGGGDILNARTRAYDAVLDYDPMGGSYAFSPIGFQGITCGGGNTENCRYSTSLKYRLKVCLLYTSPSPRDS